MLREYTSVPCTILACKIEPEGTIIKLSEGKGDDGTYEYTCSGRGASKVRMEFASSVIPVPGDFIIQESETDIYHCNAALFSKKYNVQGMYIR